MTAQRALRLARTCALIGFITLIGDRDLAFNGVDLITITFAAASVMLLRHAKGL